jgi:hypothetical protein
MLTPFLTWLCFSMQNCFLLLLRVYLQNARASPSGELRMDYFFSQPDSTNSHVVLKPSQTFPTAFASTGKNQPQHWKRVGVRGRENNTAIVDSIMPTSRGRVLRTTSRGFVQRRPLSQGFTNRPAGLGKGAEGQAVERYRHVRKGWEKTKFYSSTPVVRCATHHPSAVGSVPVDARRRSLGGPVCPYGPGMSHNSMRQIRAIEC